MKLLLFTLSILACSVLNSQVLINEYSASNMTGINDAFGDNEDWVELYNPSGASVDLTGWYLSDRSGNPLKWTFPSASINSNDHLLIFCSSRDVVQSGEFHSNFKLSQTEGDWVILSNTFGNVVDSFKIVHYTKMDHSVGRSTDGAPDFKLFTNPTPNSTNTGAQEFYTPTPVLDMAPGYYPGAISVSMTCADASAQIRYTTDGSDPGPSSILYSGPVNVNSTVVIRAAAFGTNLQSFTETNSYFIGASHTLPIVSVCSDDVYDLIANGNQGGWGGGSNKIGAFELFEQDGEDTEEEPEEEPEELEDEGQLQPEESPENEEDEKQE